LSFLPFPVEGPERDLRLQEANNFLAQVEVRRYNAQLVSTQMGTFWSNLVSYDDPDGESSEKSFSANISL
jgi:hypothetical protein